VYDIYVHTLHEGETFIPTGLLIFDFGGVLDVQQLLGIHPPDEF
jgi:hypothetical protein